jgi:hypothetical protein
MLKRNLPERFRYSSSTWGELGGGEGIWRQVPRTAAGPLHKRAMAAQHPASWGPEHKDLPRGGASLGKVHCDIHQYGVTW